MQFRKKPVAIEATRFPEINPTATIPMKDYQEAVHALAAWCGGEVGVQSNPGGDIRKMFIKINTLEGTMTAVEGDWIIKGVKGEFYPCKPDVFEESYNADVSPLALDPVADTKQTRKELDEVLQRLKFRMGLNSPAIKTSGMRNSAERMLAMRSLQVAIMWLGMDLKELAEPNPYPESYNPASPKIEPTADGLKL